MDQRSLKPDFMRYLQKSVDHADEHIKPVLQEMYEVAERNLDILTEDEIFQLIKNFDEFKAVIPEYEKKYSDRMISSPYFVIQ